MYQLINDNCTVVLDRLSERRDVERYARLRDDVSRYGVNVIALADFQKAYRAYWGVKRRDAAFCDHYFKVLAKCVSDGSSEVGIIARALATKTKGSKKPALEFSFATKIAHMIDPGMPVFDSLVAAFYLFSKPSNDLSFESRLTSHLSFHRFLSTEYERIVTQGLLATAIDRFRERFTVHGSFGEERIIDWLIWSYAALLQGGAQRDGRLLYR